MMAGNFCFILLPNRHGSSFRNKWLQRV